MALTDEGGTGMVMPVAPMYGGGYGYNGGGFGNVFGGDGGWWILLLFILLGNGGWGNGFGGYGGNDFYPWMNQSNQISGGFRDQMINDSVTGIQSAVTAGFGDVQTALCGGFAGVNATVNGAQSALSQQMTANQLADLERSFNAQTANTQAMTAIQSQLAQCCCDNRMATVQTQNIVQNEGATTRSAIQAGVQTVLDKMCQDKIDAKNEKIVELNNKINSLETNNYIQNALTAQTQYFLSLYPTSTGNLSL